MDTTIRRVVALWLPLFVFALRPATAGAQEARGVAITPWLGAKVQGGRATAGIDVAVELRNRVAVEFSLGIPFAAVLGRLQLDRDGTFYVAAGPALLYADAVVLAGGQVHGYAQAELSDAVAARVGVRGIFPLEADRIDEVFAFNIGLSIRP